MYLASEVLYEMQVKPGRSPKKWKLNLKTLKWKYVEKGREPVQGNVNWRICYDN